MAAFRFILTYIFILLFVLVPLPSTFTRAFISMLFFCVPVLALILLFFINWRLALWVVALTPIITLIALSTLFSAISLRNVRFRDLVCGQPALVIVDGKLRQETMRRNRLTLDELFEQLRGQGITDLSDVKYAVLETNGRLSVLPRSPLQPVTPEQLGLDVQDNVFLPIILINDGRVLTAEIQVSPKPDTSNLPKTGDDARPLRLLALCALCTAALMVSLAATLPGSSV